MSGYFLSPLDRVIVPSDDDKRDCYDRDVEAVLRKPLEIPLIRRMLELHLNGAVSPAAGG